MKLVELKMERTAAPKQFNYPGFCFLMDGIRSCNVNGKVNAAVVSQT